MSCRLSKTAIPMWRVPGSIASTRGFFGLGIGLMMLTLLRRRLLTDVEDEGESRSVEDRHACVFAHPGFAERRQARGELRKVLCDRLSDLALVHPVCPAKEGVNLGPPHGRNRGALFMGQSLDRLDECSDTFPAPCRTVAGVLQHDRVWLVVRDQFCSMHQCLSRIRLPKVTCSPIDKEPGTLQHHKAEPTARGIDRQDTKIVFP